MTGQSDAAAERSAHVTRGPAEAPLHWPVVEVAPGRWQLRAIADRDAEIARLRAEIAALRSRKPWEIGP